MPSRRPLTPKRLTISDTARGDIRETIIYLAEKAGAEVAERFLERIDAELITLAELGHSGVTREWVSPGLRMHVLGDYCIYFRVTDDETRIIRFLNGSRDVSAIVFEQE
jgi:plasmid stabilization system protein ParE